MKQLNLDALWSIKLDLMPATNVLAVEDLLLVMAQPQKDMNDAGQLEAFGLVDGRSRWQHTFLEQLVAGLQTRAAATAGEPFCFVTASARDVLFGEGAVVALDKEGHVQWQWRGDVQMLSAPTLTENQLAFTADSEYFISLDPTTGSEQMRVRLNNPASFHAPGLDAGLFFIPGRGSELLALSAEGKVQWQAQVSIEGWLDKMPVVAGERIIAASSQGLVVALTVADGQLAWQQTIGPEGRALSAPSTDGTQIYVGARDGVYALPVDDGRILWHLATERAVEGQPMVEGRFLYVTSHDHFCYIVDRQSGDVLWRHEMERRIELPAAVRQDVSAQTAVLFVADQGGKIAGFSQNLAEPEPPAAQEGKVQLDVAQLLRLAQRYDAKGQPLPAARAFLRAGDKEQAAQKFEEAEKWLTAVKLWHEVSRPLREAQALEGYAHSLEDAKAPESKLVAVWQQAALIYQQEGEKAKAEFCQRQVARYQQLPILDLSLEHDGLVLNAWTSLQLIVKNSGYGRASRINVNESGAQFEGEVASSQYYFRLNAGEEYMITLALRPSEYGDSVPLRLTIDYVDQTRTQHKLQKTIYLPVARVAADRVEGQMNNIFSAVSGASTVTTKEVAAWQQISFEVERELVNKLVKSFSLEELEELCFGVNIAVEEHIKLSERETRSDFARAIVLHLKRRNQLPMLIQYCRQERAHIEW